MKMARDIFKEIVEDDELRKLLMEVFKWRDSFGNRTLSCNNAVVKLADRIYEKTGIGLEQYT